MNLEEQLESRFVCAKCQHHGGEARRIAATGAGLSKLLDIQHNQYVIISCGDCGYSEIYNPRVLEGKRSLGDVLDVLFGH